MVVFEEDIPEEFKKQRSGDSGYITGSTGSGYIGDCGGFDD